MSNGLSPIVAPDLAALLALHKQDVFASMNCHQLGTIVSFNAANQTATVRLNVQAQVYNQQVEADALSAQPTPTAPNVYDYPPLVTVPVLVLSGGGSVLWMPVKAGDTCLVLFNDRNIDSWWLTGAVTVPASQRMHDLSDGLAIVGFRSLANALSGYSDDVVLHSDALLKLSNEVTTLKACFTTLFSALTGWVNTGGSTPNAATVLALNAAKAQFDSLLA